MKWRKIYNYVLYWFVSFRYYYICILCKSSRTEVFLKKVLLKNSLHSQEKACTGVSFLTTANNIINEETPYVDASVLPPDLKPI